jgi:hypothetical protein
MPVNPAQLSNDRPVTQYSTDPVSNEFHPIPVSADAASATNAVPPADQFEVLRGGTAVPSAGPAGSPPPGKGTAAKDVGLADIVGAVVNFLFQGPKPPQQRIKEEIQLKKEQIETEQRFKEQAELKKKQDEPNRIKNQIEDQQHEIVKQTIRDM